MEGIQFERVTYAYQSGSPMEQVGLEDVVLNIEASRFVAILGSGGSGKSTLLQHMNGILRPTKGKVRIFDVDIQAGKPQRNINHLRKRVGLVFQFPEQQLFAETVEQDLCFGPLNFGVSLYEARAKARRAMEQLGLDETILLQHPHELSGGQMRKVAIASILSMDPDILVLDEPTASLDPASRQELLSLLRRLCEAGKTIILVTHRLEEVLPFADEYVVMQQGKVTFHDTLEDWDRAVAAFADAGLTLPHSMRLIQEIAARLEVPRPEPFHRVEDVAAWIGSLVKMKGAR